MAQKAKLAQDDEMLALARDAIEHSEEVLRRYGR